MEVKGVPEYLIVLKIEYFENCIELFEVYNGPGKRALPGKDMEDSRESSLSIKKLSLIEVEKGEKILEAIPICKWKPKKI